MTKQPRRQLRVAGLFAGIGGIESGLMQAGHEAVLLCEANPAALEVLRVRFPKIPLHDDVRTLSGIATVDLIAAGFPCQDLSLAGTRAGLEGTRSGLVMELFRLVDEVSPEFLLLENVFNLLRLNRGAAMRTVLDEIENRGYRWAYRVVDSRGFGLPQRRLRVIILASRGECDPQDLLFTEDVDSITVDSIGPLEPDTHYGFYWTEGKRGVGWAKNAVPTIKGGSGLGIPSPPALFNTSTRLAGTPTIRDAERLQGFPTGWTDIQLDGKPVREGTRWTMVGNAVSVPVATWIGDVLASNKPRPPLSQSVAPFPEASALPTAGFGSAAGRYAVSASTHVKVAEHTPIGIFLDEPLKPLSKRALDGYIHRARTGSKRFPHGFLESLDLQAAAWLRRSSESKR